MAADNLSVRWMGFSLPTNLLTRRANGGGGDCVGLAGLGAADASEVTDAVQGDDVTQHGPGALIIVYLVGKA